MSGANKMPITYHIGLIFTLEFPVKIYAVAGILKTIKMNINTGISFPLIYYFPTQKKHNSDD